MLNDSRYINWFMKRNGVIIRLLENFYISCTEFFLVKKFKPVYLSPIFIHFLQNDAVIPAFPDLHLSPAAILKELSTYFPKFSSQTRLLTLPAPHELPPREAQEYPPNRLMF